MKDLSAERARIDREAVQYLRNFYADSPDACLGDFHSGISVADKELCPQEYQIGLRSFKTLFRSDIEEHKTALWNMLTSFYSEETKFCEEDFTPDELDFIRAALKAADTTVNEANVNSVIKTKRLVLRAVGKRDRKIFVSHLQRDGDFLSYTGRELTNENLLKAAVPLRGCAYFAVERKADKTLLGYVGLSIRKSSATGLMDCYIFKEERKNGYCKEAVAALTDRALNNRLYEPVETVRECVYKRKKIELNAIRACIPASNIAAIKTVESCGFFREATIHQSVRNRERGWTDQAIYCLIKL